MGEPAVRPWVPFVRFASDRARVYSVGPGIEQLKMKGRISAERAIAVLDRRPSAMHPAALLERRLKAGHGTLNPIMMVRIHPPQLPP